MMYFSNNDETPTKKEIKQRQKLPIMQNFVKYIKSFISVTTKFQAEKPIKTEANSCTNCKQKVSLKRAHVVSLAI